MSKSYKKQLESEILVYKGVSVDMSGHGRSVSMHVLTSVRAREHVYVAGFSCVN